MSDDIERCYGELNIILKEITARIASAPLADAGRAHLATKVAAYFLSGATFQTQVASGLPSDYPDSRIVRRIAQAIVEGATYMRLHS